MYILPKIFLFLFVSSICHICIFHLTFNNYSIKSNQSIPLILLYTHNHSHKTRDSICQGKKNGGHIVNFNSCPRKCEFSCRIQDFSQRSPAALLFFGEDFYWSFKLTDRNRTSLQQRWIFWSWEAPIHHPEYTKSGLTFNWTMTYRQDSDIVHSYGGYLRRNLSSTYFDSQSIDYYYSSQTNQPTFNIKNEYHHRKNRILWFVSNCQAKSKRNQIAKNLSLYFPIDQFGKCSKSNASIDFEQLLFQYKFYLAFENSNCQDYITEKVFYNSLAHGSIPLVLGSNENDYEKILPPNSYIYIESYQNLNLLAQQLQLIIEDYQIYSFYHQWRFDYRIIARQSGYLIDHLFCNLCIKLHEDQTSKVYSNFSQWLNKCS